MKCAKEMATLINETREQLLLAAIANTPTMVKHITDNFASQIVNHHNLSPKYSFYIAQISRKDDPNFINEIHMDNYGNPGSYSGTLYHYAALIDILTNLHYTITIRENARLYHGHNTTEITISIPSSLPCD